MSLIKRFFQQPRPVQQPAETQAEQHPNFWMYQ